MWWFVLLLIVWHGSELDFVYTDIIYIHIRIVWRIAIAINWEALRSLINYQNFVLKCNNYVWQGRFNIYAPHIGSRSVNLTCNNPNSGLLKLFLSEVTRTVTQSFCDIKSYWVSLLSCTRHLTASWIWTDSQNDNVITQINITISSIDHLCVNQ